MRIFRKCYEHKGFFKLFVIEILGIKFKFKRKSIFSIRQQLRENRPQPLFLPSKEKRSKVNISIVAIYKNEPDIVEWIEYHKLIGVQRFYLYDNVSSDNSTDLIKSYIDDGTVVYHFIPGKCMQLPVYRDAVYRYKDETNWMAIIDLDEYIVPVKNDNLSDFLNDYENYAGVGINWLVFDSNNHVKRPNNLVIEAYTTVDNNLQCDINHHIKSIVNPREVAYILNPHFCLFKKHKLTVDDNFVPIDSHHFSIKNSVLTQKVSIDKIRINHYHTKSQEDWYRKVNIGFADSVKKRSKFQEVLNFSETREDFVIHKYLPKLKEKIQKTNNNHL